MEAGRGKKRTYDEMMDEEPSTSHQGILQMGHSEVDDEVDNNNERPFYIESVKASKYIKV